MRGLLLLVVAVALAACHLTQQSQVDEVADSLCRCLEPGDPSCVDDIAPGLGSAVTPGCSDCVFEDARTCASMLDDCVPLCITNVQTPEGHMQ